MRRVALLFVVLFAAACGGDDGDDNPRTAGSELEVAAEEAVAGICRALEDDAESAVVAFQSVHGQLHDIGDALTALDRAEAAEFLRAKSAVESDISGGAPPEELQADLTGLSQAVDQALDVLDVEVSSTC